MSKFRVKDPVPAVLHDDGGQREYVSLPVGAILTSFHDVTAAVIGMFNVICERREYFVLASDLVRRCDRFN